MRLCKDCLVQKAVTEFHHYAPGKPSYKCKPCHVEAERKRQKALWANNPNYRERHNEYGKAVRRGKEPLRVNISRRGITTICKVCRQEKSTLEEFPKRNKYRLKTCNTCFNKQENLKANIKYNQDTDFRARKVHTQVKSRYENVYGVSIEHVVKTLRSQNSKCANHACGVEISLTAPKELVKPAMVDHNHKTGKFRALLCSRCNVQLGHLETSPHIVDGLKDYLIEYSH